MKSRSSELRRARPLLGTIVEIGARGPGASAGIEAAFLEVETIHQLMSFHEIDSDVSCLNRAPLLTRASTGRCCSAGRPRWRARERRVSEMADLWFVLLTVALFALVGLVVRGVERL